MSLFGKKKEKKRFKRVFFATDVHGSTRCFKKFINCGKFYDVDVLILGGDITGKMFVPIVEQTDDTFKSHFMDQEYVVRTKEELQALEEIIDFSGFYPYRTNPEEMRELSTDEVKANELLIQLSVKRLETWMKIVEERLKDTKIECYISGGNDDPLVVDSILSGANHVINPEGRVVDIYGYEMISCAYSNITPWKTPRELSEEKLAEKIDEMASQVSDMKKCIFNFHAPPIDSGLDTCQKLDTSVFPPRLVYSRGGAPVWFGAGSSAVRNAIDKYQPLLGLHGHIHESKGVDKIGRTLIINPGSEYSSGALRGVIINLDEKDVKSYQFTSG